MPLEWHTPFSSRVPTIIFCPGDLILDIGWVPVGALNLPDQFLARKVFHDLALLPFLALFTALTQVPQCQGFSLSTT